MTAREKSLVFGIIVISLLTASVFLSSAACAQYSGTAAITGVIHLTVYNVAVSDIGETSATVTWNTNENTNSSVAYGTTTPYGSISTDNIMVVDHTISLVGLLPGTVYHYQILSVDADGNSAVSTDATFMTTALTPTVTPSPVIDGGGGRSGGGGYGIINFLTGQGSLLQLGPPEQPQPPGSPEQNTLPNVPQPQNEQHPPMIPVIISTGVQNAFQDASRYFLFMGVILISLVIAIAAYIGWRQRRNSF